MFRIGDKVIYNNKKYKIYKFIGEFACMTPLYKSNGLVGRIVHCKELR